MKRKSCARNSAPNLQKYSSRSNISEDNGLVMNTISIPQEILEILLSYLELQGTLTAGLVCKRWLNVVRSSVFWKRKLEKIIPGRWQSLNTRLLSNPEGWYVYFSVLKNRTFERNLVGNPCGNMNNGLDEWQIVKGTPSLWRIGSCDISIPVAQLDGENVPQTCFQTSFTFCSKEQYVNLWAHDFTPPVMRASVPFVIEFFDFVCSPPGKSGLFHSSVTLMDSDMRQLSSNSDYNFVISMRIMPGCSSWIKVNKKFTILVANEREVVDKLKFIRVCHGGRQLENSSEKFQGPKFTNACIKIKLL